MSDAAGTLVVRAKGVGKRYKVAAEPRPRRLLQTLTGRTRPSSPEPAKSSSDFWAVRDVTFELRPGQVMGVIGRNGSGKTTLMKMIAGITVPTEGLIEVRGRVGAMLKAGTGFHPELSGRDNIALSGAILGMSKEEIAAVEGDIIDFAEIGRFIDTPVKHYSSGMGVRLGFGVSSHMPGDVMIIDEALSVGDAIFQTKCQERISTVVGQGRTVLFVSHSMQSIRTLCDSGFVLDRGKIRFMGTADESVDFYEGEVLRGQGSERPRRRERPDRPTKRERAERPDRPRRRERPDETVRPGE